jgi:FkbM family methyltransferase
MNPKVSILDVDSGKYMTWSTRDELTEVLLRDGVHEPSVIELSKLIIRTCSNKNVLDIGANIGSYSIPLARDLGDEVSFNCFEIQKFVFYQLCGNIFLNSLSNVSAHNFGISNISLRKKIPTIDYKKCWNVGAYSIDPVAINAPRTDFPNHLLTSEVDADFKSIDSLDFLPRSGLVKIDVEGHELEVIAGALQHLESSGWPPIIFESWNFDWYKEKRSLLLRFLVEIGYDNITPQIGPENYLAQHSQTTCKKIKIEKIGNQLNAIVQ